LAPVESFAVAGEAIGGGFCASELLDASFTDADGDASPIGGDFSGSDCAHKLNTQKKLTKTSEINFGIEQESLKALLVQPGKTKKNSILTGTATVARTCSRYAARER
jgi:hypothetical protein